MFRRSVVKFFELRRIPPVIRIEKCDVLASRICDAEVARGGDTGSIAAKIANARTKRVCDGLLAAVVAVVDDEDLEVLKRLRKNTLDRAQNLRAAIECRNDDGDERRA